MPRSLSPEARPLRVAHLLRPAAGGMLSQVRALLAASEGSALVAAPPEVLSLLSETVPDPESRLALALPFPPDAKAMLRAGIAAGRWARTCGATLLHGHGLRFAPLFAGAALVSRLPLVVTLHNLVPTRLSLPARAALRMTLSRARRVIAVSQAVAHSVRDIVRDDKRLVVVPNGVDVKRFSQTMLPTRAAARDMLGLLPDDVVALCLARLSPEKDVACFLEAAALLAPRLEQARFLIAGDGPLLPTLRYQITFLGLDERATLLGRRDDVPVLLAAANLLCLSSREEGLSVAVLEAMASGLPVVATQVGGIPEAVEAGETGLLVPPRDPPALARALEALLSDTTRAQVLGAAGRARVARHFTLDQMLAATRAIYREAT